MIAAIDHAPGSVDEKPCSRCKRLLPLTGFYRHPAKRGGHRSQCRDCQSRSYAVYRAKPENKQHHAAVCAAWRAKPENKKRSAVTCAAYCAKPENKARRAAYYEQPTTKVRVAAYYATPEVRARYVANARGRQMRKLRARPSGVGEAELNVIYQQRDEIITRTGIPHAVDHFFPLKHASFSGLDVPWNLRVITATENSSKSNRRPELFYSAREFQRITRQLDRIARQTALVA